MIGLMRTQFNWLRCLSSVSVVDMCSVLVRCVRQLCFSLIPRNIASLDPQQFSWLPRTIAFTSRRTKEFKTKQTILSEIGCGFRSRNDVASTIYNLIHNIFPIAQSFSSRWHLSGIVQEKFIRIKAGGTCFCICS